MLWVISAALLPAPWIALHLMGVHPPLILQVALPGLAILGAAFLLSWAAELAQHDISQALALAFLALIAVLPEYAVDMYFAWTAAKDPSYISFATANMTGANRLLIGLGWPAVVWAYWWKTKRQAVRLEKHQALEIFVLLVVTLYSFVIPIKKTLTLWDTAVLLACFVGYIWAAAKSHHVQPELEEGPIEGIARLPAPGRRSVMASFFLFAGYSIWIAAEPFAEGLIHAGRQWGIEEFLLVQWLAPLASESPEFIIALIFALRMKPEVGLGALVSSKVNQWTLLVGMLPLVYSVSLGHVGTMHLDSRQAEEILLTSAQSLFALIILVNFEFSLRESLMLAVLFVSQLFFPQPQVRYAFCFIYLLLAVGTLVFSRDERRAMGNLWKNVGLADAVDGALGYLARRAGRSKPRSPAGTPR